jgi:integrase/recombinase XerD
MYNATSISRSNNYTRDQLASRQFRLALRARHAPHFLLLSNGRALGYYRERTPYGFWIARLRLQTGRYAEHSLGRADDFEAPKTKVPPLSIAQAENKAREWFHEPKNAVVAVESARFKTSYGLCSCPIGDAYTIGHALRDYFQYRRHFTNEEALHAAISLTNYYILPLLGHKVVDEVTPDDLRSLLLRVEATPRRHGSRPLFIEMIDPDTLDPEARRRRRVTANHTYALLRTALEMAWREGRAASNRAWMNVKPFRVRNLRRLRVLSWPQAKQLVDLACPPSLRRLILSGLYTGCRITELFRIRVEDLAHNRMAIYVRPLKNYRARMVALPEEGYQFLQHVAHQRRGSELLLLRDDGSPWPHAYACEKFRNVCRQIGLSDDVVFHTLRHTYASLLLEAGTAPLIVARQLGHSTMQTVIHTYAHLTDDFIDLEFRRRFRPGFIANLELGTL